ncbi:hypothetical protein HO173_011023 [Letharia columbiana]|uniref:Uncharacterized protein n=1 Tax=Letharia columbiana TaxID=112416 RepID=A0A8H6L096_9LECA|nr:uncharacterized protein HO173_011023 [Letharia columbiana]KAF6230672.1 hypothetical protein HO173_011023 [Letharia columbiana]
MSHIPTIYLTWTGANGEKTCLNILFPASEPIYEQTKSLRQGFTDLFGHVAEMLRAKKLPLTDAVLHYAAGEWPSHVKNFLQRGGTVYAVVQACFDCAMNQDIYLGDGEHHLTFQKDIDAMPACRNDGEFVFARRQCRRLEGLPDEPHDKLPASSASTSNPTSNET